MKLAEAVIERKAINKKITELVSTIEGNMRAVDDEPQDINNLELIEELGQATTRYERLIKAINAANNEPQADANGKSISELIVERDVWRMMAGHWRSFLHGATAQQRFYALTKDQPKTSPIMPITELRKRVDDTEGSARYTDTLIQKLDWEIEVNLS